MFGLTTEELDELLRVGQACGIGSVVALWAVARKNRFSGSDLINYIYACASFEVAA